MLTKNDLQQIRLIVHEEVKSEVQSEVAPVKSVIKTIQKDIVQIRKDQKIIVNFFDREYLDLRKRVERIEEHLKLHSKN